MKLLQSPALLLVLFTRLLVGHGFASRTLIKTDHHFSDIYQLSVRKNKQKIVSYDINTNQYDYQRITQTGQGTTNCYIKLCVDHASNDDIICTPSQEFYLLNRNQWLPAYQLKVGDVLLSHGSTFKQVTLFQFIKQLLTVYTIEVANTHTYCVGQAAVVTHNNSYELITPLTIPICGAISAAIGAVGGPIPCLAVAVGTTAICYMVRSVVNIRRTSYQLSYDIAALEQAIEQPLLKFDSGPQIPNTPPEFPGGGQQPQKPDDKIQQILKKLAEAGGKLNNKLARALAKALGYTEVGGLSHNELVFKKGRDLISPDNTSHIGGVWKMFRNSLKNRVGTFDALLKTKVGK